jgi:hypothetical protein
LQQLRIPEAYVPGIRKLASLQTAEIENLTLALSEAIARLKTGEIVSQVQGLVSGFTRDELQDVVQALTSLAGTFGAYDDVSIDQFVADVLDAMRRDSEEFRAPATGWEHFGRQLAALLKTKSVRISSRADDVQHEEPNVFTTARILSDLRPVFDPETAEPHGALIIHKLKVTYFHDGEYSDIYISMDNADLKLLRSILDRAEKKTEALKSIMDKAALTYFRAE